MAAFLALNGAAFLLALLLAIALGLGGRTSGLVLGTLSGYLVVVHSVVLMAGLLGRLTAGGVAALLALAIAGVLVLAVCLRKHTLRVRLDDAGPVGAPRLTALALFAPLAALAAGVVWAWPHLFDATRVWVWDDFTYHMVYPALWLSTGAIGAPTPVQSFTLQAWYPLSASLVSAWFMVPFDGLRAEALAWVSLTGVLYAAIVAAGAAELLSRLGCGRGAWSVPLVLFATSDRTAIMASSFSDADLAQAATLFAAFVFAVPRGDAESRRDAFVDACAAGLLSGIALGIKVNAAPQAVIVLLMTALRAAMPSETIGVRVRAAARAGLVVVLAWAVTGGYWYARNVVSTGNPVYPAAFLVWSGATFPETSLVEYGRQYGLRRAVGDALAVYLSWPRLHALLAVAGLVGLAGWLGLRRRLLTRARRFFGYGTVAIASAVLILLPRAPYSAGNAMTFRSGFVHWDSMRYVALLPLLGWVALGFLVDAGGGRWRAPVAALIACAALLALGAGLQTWGLLLIATVLCALLPARLRSAVSDWRVGGVRGRVLAVGAGTLIVAGIVVGAHGAKTAATSVAFYREPLFGAAAAVLDREPAGTRVAVFGDQWIYPAFGDRAHLLPVRLDRNGRLATAPIADGMEPGDITVDGATFRANLRASSVDVVVVVHQPHPGRPADLPSQHTALESAGGARLLYRDRAVAIWRVEG